MNSVTMKNTDLTIISPHYNFFSHFHKSLIPLPTICSGQPLPLRLPNIHILTQLIKHKA